MMRFHVLTGIGFQQVAFPSFTKAFSQIALAGLHCAKKSVNVMTAEMNMVTDIVRSSHFLHLLGPAMRSIKKATDIFPIAILNMHIALDIVLSLMISGTCSRGM